jgi:hypothetical protein
MKKFSMKKVAALSALGVVAVSQAHATDPTASLFAAVDISAVATAVGTMGVAIVGIALAMKGISLVKAAISKV